MFLALTLILAHCDCGAVLENGSTCIAAWTRDNY
jgi:hypothetical protein